MKRADANIYSDAGAHKSRASLSVAEVLVGLATDTRVYSNRRGEVLRVNALAFTIRAFDSSWHPGLLGRSLFRVAGAGPEVVAAEELPREPHVADSG